MANTVIFETQREDGTWKTWKNVAIPVKYGNLLDEQLDYAVVSLARVKRAQFKPLTRAKLTITSNTQHGGVQTKEMLYFIANDDAFETPIGSEAYNHELTLIELTKFLECFPLESLCFTNPNGNDYTREATTPTITDEANQGADELLYKWIDKTSSDIKTPAAIGTIYNLYNLEGYGIGYPADEDEAVVTIENKNGTKSYNSKDYSHGASFSNIAFEIAEGENKITYEYRLALNARPYGWERFTIYGVENKYPLKPWTVKGVIERILDLVEPTERGGVKRFSLSIPEGKAHIFEQIAPEFTFTRMTLREALQVVGGFIHAEPRLGGIYDINWDFYGEQERAKIHNYRTGKDKYIDETKYRALQSSFNVDQACTKLDSYQDNLVNRVHWERGTTAQPFNDGEQTLRTETAYIRGEENTAFHFPTQQGVDRIVKFEYIDENGNKFDIAPYVFEEKVYNYLSSYEGAYPQAKAYALYYTQSGKGINGFFFKAPSAVANGAFKNYAIVNILERVGAKIPEGIKADGKDGNAYDKMKFRLTYVPIYSTRVSQSKAYLDEYLPLPRVVNYAQSDNSAETRFFGENIKGAVSRMGNPEKTYTLNLRNLNNIPKTGQLWDNEHYIVSVSTAVNQDLFEVSVGLSKNFNRKSQYIGASSIKRIYEVSEEMVQQRHTVYTDYIVLSKKEPPTVNIYDTGLLLGDAGVKAVASTFTSGWYFINDEISCVLARGMTKKGEAQETVVLPVIASAFGNAMEFTWEYKDNFSAGLMNKEFTGEIKGSFSTEVEYTDYYGRIYWYEFSLMSHEQFTNLGAITDAASLPGLLPDHKHLSPFTSSRYIGTRENVPLIERKDSREALKKTYTLEFVTDEPTFIIGSEFARKCPLVFKDDDETYVPTLYILNKRINKFATQFTMNDVAADLGWAKQPQLSEDGALFKSFSIEGKVATEDGLSWVYAIAPHKGNQEIIVEDEDGNIGPLNTDYEGEILIGENIDIKAGVMIGGVNGIAVHDVFKYIKAKKSTPSGGDGGGEGEGGTDEPTPEEPETPEQPEEYADMIIENMYMNGEGWHENEEVLGQSPAYSYVDLNGDTVFVYESLEMAIKVSGVTDAEDLQPPLKLKKGQKITIYPFTRDGMVVPEYSEHWTYKITIPKYVDEDGTKVSANGELYYNGGIRMGLLWGYLPFDIEFSVQQEGEQFIGTIKVTDVDGDIRSVTSVDFSQGVTIEVK